MQKNVKTVLGIAVILVITTLSLSNSMVFAEFELGEIENLNDWFSSSSVVNFHEDFKTNMLFSFVNESLGLEITPYLSLQSQINVPLNFTGYLSKKIQDDVSVYGIQIGSSLGNMSLGINGSIDLTTTATETIHISIDQGSTDSIASFETIIGENISIPINFSPIIVSFAIAEMEGEMEGVTANLSLDPKTYLNGSISVSSIINEQELYWTTGDEVYFDEISMPEELGMYNISLSDISVNFEDVHLIITEISAIITLYSLFGDVTNEFLIDFENVDWGESQETLDMFTIFLLNNIFELEDQEIRITINQVSFPWLSVVPILAITAIIISRKKRG